VTSREAEAIVDAFDDNGDGVVQYDDFVGLLCGNAGEGSAVPASGHDLGFLQAGAADPYDRNLAGATRVWAGQAVRRVQGPTDAITARRSGVFDVADGRGADALAEGVRLSHDRKEADLRRAFSDSVKHDGVFDHSHVGGLGGGAGGDSGGGADAGAEGAADAGDASASGHSGAARAGAGAGAGAGAYAEDLLPLNVDTGGVSVAGALGGGAVEGTRFVTEAMHSVHLGPASDAALGNTLPLGTLRDPQRGPSVRQLRDLAWRPLQPPLTTGLDLSLSARARVPPDAEAAAAGPMMLVDHEPDPLEAAPETGRGALVLGEVGGARQRDARARLLRREEQHVRITARGPLQHVLGLGGNAGVVERAAGRDGAAGAPPPFSPMRASVRDRRLEERRSDFLRRSGVRGAAEHEREREGFGFEAGAADGYSAPASASAPASPARVPLLELQPLAHAPSLHDGEAGGGGGAAPPLSTAERLRKSRAKKLERIGLGGANSALAPDLGTSAGGAGAGHVMGRDANANDLRVRLQRAEGDRTTFLIAPPPAVLTSHSSEDAAWHFASAQRLAMTQRRVPEQYFASLVRDDRLKNVREQVDDYTARVATNMAAEAAAATLRANARVEAKRKQYAAYRLSIKPQTDKDHAIHAEPGSPHPPFSRDQTSSIVFG